MRTQCAVALVFVAATMSVGAEDRPLRTVLYVSSASCGHCTRVERETLPELTRRGYLIADYAPRQSAADVHRAVDTRFPALVKTAGLLDLRPAWAVYEGDRVVARHYGFHTADQVVEWLPPRVRSPHTGTASAWTDALGDTATLSATLPGGRVLALDGVTLRLPEQLRATLTRDVTAQSVHVVFTDTAPRVETTRFGLRAAVSVPRLEITADELRAKTAVGTWRVKLDLPDAIPPPRRDAPVWHVVP